jgi:hypothetical protein
MRRWTRASRRIDRIGAGKARGERRPVLPASSFRGEAPLDAPPSLRSRAGSGQAVPRRTGRCSVRCIAFRPGPASTDRDRVDVCPCGSPRHHATMVPLEKTAIPSPRRKQPIYQGQRASRRQPSGPRSAVAAHRFRRDGVGDVAKLDGCDRDGRRRTGGDRQDARILGRSAAAGEGTGSRFFRRGRIVASEVDAGAGTSSTRSRSGEVGPRQGVG